MLFRYENTHKSTINWIHKNDEKINRSYEKFTKNFYDPINTTHEIKEMVKML